MKEVKIIIYNGAVKMNYEDDGDYGKRKMWNGRANGVGGNAGAM